MERAKRKVISFAADGMRKEWDSEYAFAKEMGVSITAVQLAKRSNGTCAGWRIYDAPDMIRERIKELEDQLKIVGE